MMIGSEMPIWEITGIIVPFLLGSALAVLGFQRPWYGPARWCIELSGIILLVATAWWLWTTRWQPFNPELLFRAAASGLIAILVLAGAPVAVSRIYKKERSETHQASLPWGFASPWSDLPIKGAQGEAKWPHTWRDIEWRNFDAPSVPDEGWLVGVVEWGGGSGPEMWGPLGTGIVLLTTDGGKTWSDVTRQIDTAPDPAVGYAQFVKFTSRQIGGRKMSVGFIAASNGIYRTQFPQGTPEHEITWERITPYLQHEDCIKIQRETRHIPPDCYYKHFNSIGFSEYRMYAVGWNGFMRAENSERDWEIEQLSVTYDLRSIVARGDPPGDFWVVGKNSPGAPGANPGAVYHRMRGDRGTLFWQREYIAKQPLNDIAIAGKGKGAIAIAVGEHGTILKGKDLETGLSEWDSVTPKDGDEQLVTQNLSSVAYDEQRGVFWVVGDGGVMLRSTDLGETWAMVPQEKTWSVLPPHGYPNLSRVKFFGADGFITGIGTVLRYGSEAPSRWTWPSQLDYQYTT